MKRGTQASAGVGGKLVGGTGGTALTNGRGWGGEVE